MGQTQQKAACHLDAFSHGAGQIVKGFIMNDEVQHRGEHRSVAKGLEQAFELLVDALADGALAEAVAAGDVERRHQGLPVGEQIKGHGRDGRRGTHRIQLGGVREHDGQHSDALEKIKHAQ